MAEENNEPLPPLTLNLPPGYLRVTASPLRNTATSTSSEITASSSLAWRWPKSSQAMGINNRADNINS